MITAILTIAGIIVALGVLITFILRYAPEIIELMQWSLEIATSINDLFPTWILPVVGVLILIAVVSLIVKVV